MWSLGCVVYYLFQDTLPYYSSAREQKSWNKQVEESIKRLKLDNSDESLVDFVASLLKPRAERLTAKEAKNHPWLLLTDDSSPVVHLPSSPASSSSATPRITRGISSVPEDPKSALVPASVLKIDASSVWLLNRFHESVEIPKAHFRDDVAVGQLVKYQPQTYKIEPRPQFTIQDYESLGIDYCDRICPDPLCDQKECL